MNEIFSMTNSTKLISLEGKQYILRLPGVGTDKLINRKQEYEVYKTIAPYRISDEVLFFDKTTGVKIAKYIANCHNVNPNNIDEVRLAIKAMHRLHDLHLSVDFEFNLKERIEFYEILMKKSKYNDYGIIKEKILRLLDRVSTMTDDKCLCHIDPNQDNILIDNESNEVKALVDWEYAAMQDPLVDVAMFCIYAGYGKDMIDIAFRMYCRDMHPAESTIFKYYTYIASCGLLWSNWCEYKNQLGQDFGGAYELSQYNYAKTFSKYAEEYAE